jgi:hypothetical protein
VLRSIFRSDGQTYELVPSMSPVGPRLRPDTPGERVPIHEAPGILAQALRSPADRRTLHGVVDLLGLANPDLEDPALHDRLLAALRSERLVLLRLEAHARYRGRPGEATEKPQDEEFERPPPDTTDWIEILLVDEQGHGIPGQRYLIITPDGQHRRGFTDSLGSARITRIPSGDCKVSFPDLDAKAWAPGMPA